MQSDWMSQQCYEILGILLSHFVDRETKVQRDGVSGSGSGIEARAKSRSRSSLYCLQQVLPVSA